MFRRRRRDLGFDGHQRHRQHGPAAYWWLSSGVSNTRVSAKKHLCSPSHRLPRI